MKMSWQFSVIPVEFFSRVIFSFYHFYSSSICLFLSLFIFVIFLLAILFGGILFSNQNFSAISWLLFFIIKMSNARQMLSKRTWTKNTKYFLLFFFSKVHIESSRKSNLILWLTREKSRWVRASSKFSIRLLSIFVIFFVFLNIVSRY